MQQAQQDALLRGVVERLKPHEGRYTIVRNFSYLAAAGFADCSLDWVFVDAVHDYEGALRDMVDWWPLLRAGGVMGGHDNFDGHVPSGIFGVKAAADRFGVAVNLPVYTTVSDQAPYVSFWIVK